MFYFDQMPEPPAPPQPPAEPFEQPISREMDPPARPAEEIFFGLAEYPVDEVLGPPAIAAAATEPKCAGRDPAACPECGGAAPPYSTKNQTQYRKCSICGHRFKTIKPASG